MHARIGVRRHPLEWQMRLLARLTTAADKVHPSQPIPTLSLSRASFDGYLTATSLVAFSESNVAVSLSVSIELPRAQRSHHRRPGSRESASTPGHAIVPTSGPQVRRCRALAPWPCCRDGFCIRVTLRDVTLVHNACTHWAALQTLPTRAALAGWQGRY